MHWHLRRLGPDESKTASAMLQPALQLAEQSCVSLQDGGSEGSKARRKVGRWREEETNELINLTQAHGRGKWKLILEKGSGIFQNRTQVRVPGLPRSPVAAVYAFCMSFSVAGGTAECLIAPWITCGACTLCAVRNGWHGFMPVWKVTM